MIGALLVASAVMLAVSAARLGQRLLRARRLTGNGSTLADVLLADARRHPWPLRLDVALVLATASP